MSDKASEHCADEFDIYWLLSPQREEQRPTFRRFYLAGYEKGREAGRAEGEDSGAWSALAMVQYIWRQQDVGWIERHFNEWKERYGRGKPLPPAPKALARDGEKI